MERNFILVYAWFDDQNSEGVYTEVLGSYETSEEAEKAMDKYIKKTMIEADGYDASDFVYKSNWDAQVAKNNENISLRIHQLL